MKRLARPAANTETIPRLQRILSDDEEQLPLGILTVRTISGMFRYVKLGTSDYGEQKRWYYFGRVRVAFIVIRPASTHQLGDVLVFINSRPGNGGTPFPDIKSAQDFIVKELVA